MKRYAGVAATCLVALGLAPGTVQAQDSGAPDATVTLDGRQTVAIRLHPADDRPAAERARGAPGTGTLSVDGKAVATQKMERTLPLILQWDESFDVG